MTHPASDLFLFPCKVGILGFLDDSSGGGEQTKQHCASLSGAQRGGPCLSRLFNNVQHNYLKHP